MHNYKLGSVRFQLVYHRIEVNALKEEPSYHTQTYTRSQSHRGVEDISFGAFLCFESPTLPMFHVCLVQE